MVTKNVLNYPTLSNLSAKLVQILEVEDNVRNMADISKDGYYHEFDLNEVPKLSFVRILQTSECRNILDLKKGTWLLCEVSCS